MKRLKPTPLQPHTILVFSVVLQVYYSPSSSLFFRITNRSPQTELWTLSNIFLNN